MIRKRIPKYTIDLNDPPEQRWVPLVTQYKKECLASIEHIEGMFSGFTGSCLKNIVLGLTRAYTYIGFVKYYDEIKGISEV
jgi:hypothetical protein